MGDFTDMFDGGQFWAAGMDTGASHGVLVTASATANTKGAWAEISASLAWDTDGVMVCIGQANAAARDFLIDVGVGAAGSEQVLIPNLLYGRGNVDAAGGPGILFFPIQVPAGTRMSARAACNVASGTCRVGLAYAGHGFASSSPLSKVTAYGANTADSGGTNMDPGATANTKGAWTELSASTDPVRALGLILGGQSVISRAAGTWMIDLGVGAAGAETIVITNLATNSVGSQDYVQPDAFPVVPVSIPAGSRLAARVASSITNSAQRTFDLIAYGCC